MQTIAIINEKGGVGKSTSAVSLGGAYAKAGKRCLVLDLDPQASLTRGLLGSAETDALPAARTIAALFGDSFAPAEQLVIPTAFEGLSILPGSRLLKPVNCLQPEYGPLQFVLRDLDFARLGFERVLIDCPPNLEFCSWCAMVAADFVLTPVVADEYGAQALQFVGQAVANVRAVNPRLAQLGYLRTLFQPRSALQLLYSEQLGRDYPGLLLSGFVPFAAQFREAAMARAPISHYKPRCAGAKSVAAIVEEIESRMARPAVPADYKEVA